MRKERSQRGHILLSIRAFLRLEVNRFKRGVSWYESKLSMIRQAVSSFMANPTIRLLSTAEVL